MNVVALSSLCELWVVAQPGTGYECRKCRLSNDATVAVPNADVLILHLDNHRKAGHRGAELCHERITRCSGCGGRKEVSYVQDNQVKYRPCNECKGDGLNALGRKRPTLKEES